MHEWANEITVVKNQIMIKKSGYQIIYLLGIILIYDQNKQLKWL